VEDLWNGASRFSAGKDLSQKRGANVGTIPERRLTEVNVDSRVEIECHRSQTNVT
jgi:hypothetical protein